MKLHISCTILSILITVYSTYGMQHALGTIETQIFLRQIKLTNGKMFQSSPLIITTLVDPHAQDTFSQLVIQKIKDRERTKVSHNFLENYTEYCHKKDNHHNSYIELVSTFDNKDSLLAIVNKE